MYPYLRNESEEEEFDATFDIAIKLFSRRESDRQKAADKLIRMGKKSVRPVICTIEYGIRSGMSDEDLDSLDNLVEDVVVRIGEEALPDLEDFATNGYCNIYVNEFAQEAIFKIMKLEGEDKRKVCNHGQKILIEKGRKKLWRCVFCDGEFEYKKEK